ncbi:hypothetical protein HJC23_003122 [Cyclotella cryptica]|uniref:Golgin-84 n=1 Tax=Cyclotella cryptica TaxID=29204 RepID=A0ABD3P550_9STRA|eukprot:CCRYP_017539-RA/>CCRYP_017539-RA protein AED:0.17 eAED:0.17 QI:95/1/1/1/0/0/2/618/785
MSRWLRNVNALLENLDSQVEETVEDRFNTAREEDDEAEVSLLAEEEASGVNDILARRGLLEEEDDELEADGVGGPQGEEGGDVAEEEVVDFGGDSSDGGTDEQQTKTEESGESSSKQGDIEVDDENNQSIGPDAYADQTASARSADTVQQEGGDESCTSKNTPSAPSSTNLPFQDAALSNQAATAQAANTTSAATNKELRKLRRHVLQLNSSLETAEREIEAQRLELDRAASRIERDRSRHKQEKEAAEASHKAELASLIASHEKSMANQKEAQEAKLKEMEGRILRAEQARAREGGERDAELAEALERERFALETVAKLTEEKDTMSERVASLSAETSRLETRLEHALSQFELARERERNAEEQLDKVLSLHARQLGMRQKRESELEQTVADLGAALVVAKGKVERAGMAETGSGERDREQEEEGLKERLADCQDEIETLRAQLTLERQRCVTLHGEMQDLAKEQADELSAAHARQRHYERKISDLTTLVAKLQSASTRLYAGGDGNLASIDGSGGVDDFGRHGLQYSGDEKKETDHLRKQIASLSEKIFEQQSKLDRSSGEISTFKTRLQSAILRAETAEKALESVNQRLILMDMPGDGGYAVSGISSADEEMAMGSVARRKKGGGKRRPPMGSDPTRRGIHRNSKVESIRSALGLHPGRIPAGGCQETMAVVLDTCDTVAIDLGSHFRHYPLSRLAFMLYLVILHAWAFFLLVYHAHAQGTGGLDHYSPESMMLSYRHAEQVPKVVPQVPGLRPPTTVNEDSQIVEQVPDLGQPPPLGIIVT